MTEAQAHEFLVGVFTESERQFLFAHPEFQEALARATEAQLPELNKLGVKFLLDGGYEPPKRNPPWRTRPQDGSVNP